MTTKTDKTATATDAGRAPRLTAFRAWGRAEGAAGAALVACFHATAEHGETSASEVAEGRGWHALNADGQNVPNGSAVAYASTFNTAAKASAILGIKATRDLIDKVAKGASGRVHVAIAEAMRAVGKGAKDGGIKTANAAQGRTLAKAALAAVEAAAVARQATKGEPKARGARGQNAATVEMAAASATSGQDWRHNVAAVRLAANMATRIALPEGREAAARAYLKALQDAAELGAKLEA